MKNSIITFCDVEKTYRLYNKSFDRIKELFWRTGKFSTEFNALKDININISKGEAVGIIGKNGAGKSTLLKLMSGIIVPTKGNIDVKGRVAAILELGAGFNPEYTGKENIMYNCMLMGIEESEVKHRLPAIIEFADIGEHINQPLKTYSSGMIARLAFAAAVNVEPDILIVDEALSVGDMYFQAKSIAKMKELMKERTVIFVSHTMEVVRSFCSRAIYLKDNTVYMDGDVKVVTQKYETENHDRIAILKSNKNLDSYISKEDIKIKKKRLHDDFVKMIDTKFENRVKHFRAGTGEVKIVNAELIVDGINKYIAPFGSECQLKVLILCKKDISEGSTVGYMVRNSNGVDVFGLNIYNKAQLLPELKAGDMIEINFAFKNILAPGTGYTISVGIKPELHHSSFIDNIYSVLEFSVPSLENHNWVPGLIYVEQKFDYEVHRGVAKEMEN